MGFDHAENLHDRPLGDWLLEGTGGAGVACIWDTALAAERSLASSSNSAPADVRDAIGLVARGAVDVRSMITHRFPLEQAPRAFAQLVAKDAHGMFKAVFDVKRAGT